MSTLHVLPAPRRVGRDRRRPATPGQALRARPRAVVDGVRGFTRPEGAQVPIGLEAAPRPVVTEVPEVRPTTRLTRRGRVVLVAAVLTLVLGAMTALGGFATATRHPGTPEPVRVVEVGPGDTLYSLAGDVAAPGHVREMVHRIQELNSLSGATIRVGQRLAVPRD